MTSPRRLPDHRTVYRIGDPGGTYPVYSPEGARLASGRWHSAGAAVIYAAEHFSTAMLEQLAHWNGVLPPNQHYIEIVLPAGLSYEVVTPDSLPDWRQPNGNPARQFGMGWYRDKRSAVLIVPSVAAPLETNVVINATHPEFARIRGDGLEKPVAWDDRLFR